MNMNNEQLAMRLLSRRRHGREAERRPPRACYLCHTLCAYFEIALSRFCGERDIITRVTPEYEMLREILSPRGPQNLRVPLTKYTTEYRARLECLFGARNRKGAPDQYYSILLLRQTYGS